MFKASADQAVVKDAMTAIESNTCLRFSKRASENNYISFFDGGSGACWATVGMVGGMQNLSLGDGCVDKETIIHEILHAMGFDHEQMRPDRDQYITILWDKINPDGRDQFEISTADVQSEMAYGYNSVMHYESSAMAENPSERTMLAKDPKYQPLLDESFHRYIKCDAERVNVLYNCTSLITRDPTCYK